MRDLSWVPKDLKISAYEVLRIVCGIEEFMEKRRNIVLNRHNWSLITDHAIDRVEDCMISSGRCPKIDFDKIFSGG